MLTPGAQLYREMLYIVAPLIVNCALHTQFILKCVNTNRDGQMSARLCNVQIYSCIAILCAHTNESKSFLLHIEQEWANRFGRLVGLSTYYISVRQLGREWNSILAAHIRYVLRLILPFLLFLAVCWLLYNILYSRIYV